MRKGLRKRLMTFALVGALAFMPMSGRISRVSADEDESSEETIEEIEAKKAATEQKIKDAEGKLEELQKNREDVSFVVSQLDEEIGEYVKKIDELNITKTQLQAEIAVTELKIQNTMYEEQLQYDNMKERIQYAYENGDEAYIDALMNVDDYKNMLNNSEYASQISEYDQKQLNKLCQIRDSIGVYKNLLKEKLEKVEFKGYVESIENNAFEQCANLKELYFNGDAPTNVGNEIFGSFRNVTIFYNKNASGWETPIWNGYNTQPVQGEDVFFTVNFYGFNNELLSTQKVKQGENAVVDFVIPEVQGYEFVGWTELLENVQSDMNIYDVYQKIEPKSYTVTLIDWDETVLKVEEVQEGKSATAPANPIREGYKFIGWDKDFSKVTYNMFVYAQYELIQEPTPTPIDEVIKGDVDNNGSVEAADATAVLRHVAQLTVIEGNSALAADVDGNGVIEAADATMILRFVAQLITSF